MRTAISMTAYNRPEFLKQVLHGINGKGGLLAANRFVDRPIHCFLEPGVPETQKVLDDAKVPYTINPRLMNCAHNTYLAIAHAFSDSKVDFVIHVEDDTVPSNDFILMMEYMRDRTAKRDDIFSISGYMQHIPVHDLGHQSYVLRNNFCPWGLGLTRHIWKEVEPHWDHDYSKRGWDINLNENLRQGRLEVAPVISRIQNIGTYGCHVPSPEFHAANQHSTCWIEDQ